MLLWCEISFTNTFIQYVKEVIPLRGISVISRSKYKTRFANQ